MRNDRKYQRGFHCECCGCWHPLREFRSDAMYCDRVCKQRMYRERKREAKGLELITSESSNAKATE